MADLRRLGLGILLPKKDRGRWVIPGFYDRSALSRLKRTIADASHPFAAWALSDGVALGLPDPDPEIARVVAEAEAEGAALIGAEPCPTRHGLDSLPADSRVNEAFGSFPCPTCGAVV